MLEVRDLSVQFSGLKALTDVSLDVAPGEVKALIGPNGAGKTTLFNAITGYVRPTSGRVALNGEEIQALTAHEIAAKGVSRTFQNGGLFGEMTVLENVLTGLHAEIPAGVLGTLLGLSSARRAEREAVARARRLLDLMDIAHMADQPVRDLSGGQQRMVEIVRALATEPPLLMLDEPAVGLAPPVRTQLMEIVRRLAGEEGVGIVLIEHAIDLVMKGADRIVVLAAGQVIAEGTPDEVRQNQDVLEAYLGHA
ncbi:ABC transporter ATP-binding protein [Kaustia mangrovi]|uniref:ABC transporter ATP-binding protein n=1 Tax=Kaustia mangrovi TaxID=2593653 RepID=A0A7S8HBM7_9HYPH|nr:ABC transporter ATP-binding protein [Kaustia mangrovi]QPC42358.1 ABC transporter ATP-binding protein [Kaustia mangrovi]